MSENVKNYPYSKRVTHKGSIFALVDLVLLNRVTHFCQNAVLDHFRIPPDPMGLKDFPIYDYICV